MTLEEFENINAKIKDAKKFSDYRAALSDEELVAYVLAVHLYNEEIESGEENVIKDILLLLKATRRSTRHSLFLLEKAKDALLQLSFLQL